MKNEISFMTMAPKFILLVLSTSVCTVAFGQAVGINTESIPNDAILNIHSGGSKGMLPPKLTSAQRPGSATAGLTIWNTNTQQYEVYDGGWRRIGGGFWKQGASADDTYHDPGEVGIGTNNPTAPLHVQSGTPVKVLLQDAGNGTVALEFRSGGQTRQLAVNNSGAIGFGDGGAFGNILQFQPGSQNITLNGVSGGLTPTGGIIMWSGSIASIPAGWALCDGSNGTPNLRDRFVVGAGTSYAAGSSGADGGVTLSTQHLPSHRHTFSGTTTSNGDHSHSTSIRTRTGVGNAAYTVFWADSDPPASATTSFSSSTAGAHTHQYAGNTEYTGSGQSFQVTPPYYALAYIMKL